MEVTISLSWHFWVLHRIHTELMASNDNRIFFNLSITLLSLYLRTVLGNPSFQFMGEQLLRQWDFLPLSVGYLLLTSSFSFLRKFKISPLHLLLKPDRDHIVTILSISRCWCGVWAYSYSVLYYQYRKSGAEKTHSVP